MSPFLGSGWRSSSTGASGMGASTTAVFRAPITSSGPARSQRIGPGTRGTRHTWPAPGGRCFASGNTSRWKRQLSECLRRFDAPGCQAPAPSVRSERDRETPDPGPPTACGSNLPPCSPASPSASSAISCGGSPCASAASSPGATHSTASVSSSPRATASSPVCTSGPAGRRASRLAGWPPFLATPGLAAVSMRVQTSAEPRRHGRSRPPRAQ
jgi:hypothetical protein